MTDLFDSIDEPLLQRLRARGWNETAGVIKGRLLWKRPDGAVFDEEEAFAQLAALERKEAGE